jgi:hypothetical protein
MRDLRRQAEARPKSVRGTHAAARSHDDEAAVEQSFQGLVNSIRGKILLNSADQLSKALPNADRRGERTIKFAMKKELPVLGIKAHHIWWQNIHAEIRRKSQNVVTVIPHTTSKRAGQEANTRAFMLFADSADRHRNADVLQNRPPPPWGPDYPRILTGRPAHHGAMCSGYVEIDEQEA